MRQHIVAIGAGVGAASASLAAGFGMLLQSDPTNPLYIFGTLITVSFGAGVTAMLASYRGEPPPQPRPWERIIGRNDDPPAGPI
jgi:peptidoglycan/LPS O-acetylase OafA/YrhL